jgi:hypothetical protein
MKKALFLGALFCCSLFMTSCTKDYTCTCTILGDTSITEFNNAKKSDAETACEAAELSAKIIDPGASCSLN